MLEHLEHTLDILELYANIYYNIVLGSCEDSFLRDSTVWF